MYVQPPLHYHRPLCAVFGLLFALNLISLIRNVGNSTVTRSDYDKGCEFRTLVSIEVMEFHTKEANHSLGLIK
jgi:hypothetical protein